MKSARSLDFKHSCRTRASAAKRETKRARRRRRRRRQSFGSFVQPQLVERVVESLYSPEFSTPTSSDRVGIGAGETKGFDRIDRLLVRVRRHRARTTRRSVSDDALQ